MGVEVDVGMAWWDGGVRAWKKRRLRGGGAAVALAPPSHATSEESETAAAVAAAAAAPDSSAQGSVCRLRFSVPFMGAARSSTRCEHWC